MLQTYYNDVMEIIQSSLNHLTIITQWLYNDKSSFNKCCKHFKIILWLSYNHITNILRSSYTLRAIISSIRSSNQLSYDNYIIFLCSNILQISEIYLKIILQISCNHTFLSLAFTVLFSDVFSINFLTEFNIIM